MRSVRRAYLAIAATSLATLAPAMAGCRGDGRSEATPVAGSVGAEPAVEIVLRDDVERGALLANDRVFVQTAGGSLFLHHRADGRRTPLSVPPDASGKPPQMVWAQGLADGRVAAYDHRARRVLVFDTTGAVVGTTALEAPESAPNPVAAFSDGRMVVLRDWLPSPYVQETGEYADTSALMPISSDARPTGPDIPVTMAQRFAALDRPRASDETPRGRGLNVVATGVFDGRGRHSIAVPLSPTTSVGAAADGFYVGRSDSAEVRFLDPTGRELSRLTIAETTLAVDAATVARVRRAPEDTDDLGIPFAEPYRQVRVPDRTPRYRQLRADHAGRLWVEAYSLDADAPAHWVVYARNGMRIGSLTLPAGARLLDASATEMLLARRGHLGTTLVRVVGYRLR